LALTDIQVTCFPKTMASQICWIWGRSSCTWSPSLTLYVHLDLLGSSVSVIGHYSVARNAHLSVGKWR